MNKISLLFAFLLISNIVFAQKKKNQELTQKDVSPPGAILIERDDMVFWIDQTEIANIHWLEFLADLQKSNPEMYAQMLPDSTVWQAHLPAQWVIENKNTENTDTFINEKGDTLFIRKTNYMTENYLNQRGFRFFPVVGVSYEQAQEYCKWRSKVVTKNYNSGKKNKKLENYQVEITYRLPTIQEWEFAAQAYTKDDYGFEILGSKRAKKLKRCYPKAWHRANTFRGKGNYAEIQGKSNGILITEYIYAYFPNNLNLYNMIGNVAEMVQEKGIAKGGSWLDKLENCKIKSHKTYEKSNAWLGFRCVCEVKIKKIEQL